jgi:hypothetical protein
MPVSFVNNQTNNITEEVSQSTIDQIQQDIIDEIDIPGLTTSITNSVQSNLNVVADANGELAQFGQTIGVWRATGINLLATGQTTLVATSSALSFIPYSAMIELTAVTGVLTVPVVRIGNNGTFSNLAPLFTTTGLTTVRTILTIPLVTTVLSIDIGSSAIKFDVQTAGLVASVATANVYLFGILR